MGTFVSSRVLRALRARTGASAGVIIALAGLSIIGSAAHAAEKGALTGAVVDREGRPVVGARVSYERKFWRPDRKDESATATSDSAGRFRLHSLDPEFLTPARIFIDAEGFARLTLPQQSLSIFPGRDHDLGTLRLDRGRIVAGRVLGPEGDPQAGVSVQVFVGRYEMGRTVGDIGPEVELTTDADGRFRTPPLPVGELSLTFFANGFRRTHCERTFTAPIGTEDIDEIVLEREVPFTGTVVDLSGRPIADVRVGGTVGFDAVTDSSGKFTLHGLGPDPRIQLRLTKPGFVGRNGILRANSEGVRFWESDRKPEAIKELVVPLEPCGTFEGAAVDADTGEPVVLDQVVLCFFERNAAGEVVLSGCRNDRFDQPAPGRFRVSFSDPAEYHLTFKAKGYEDAEAFTPKFASLKSTANLEVKMKKAGAGSGIAVQRFSGTVTRDGAPIAAGWVGLWMVRDQDNAVNTSMMRGRTVSEDPIVYASVLVEGGRYSIDAPFQYDKWFLVVAAPGRGLTVVGPLAIGLNEKRRVEIACQEGGTIAGSVTKIPRAWRGFAWVVAFNRSGLRVETRVGEEGSFAFGPLPPGEYGLKVGHDGMRDPEVYPGELLDWHPEAYKLLGDPWKQATRIRVAEGMKSAGVIVEYPR